MVAAFEKLPVEQGRDQIAVEAWVFGYELPLESIEDMEIPGPSGVLRARVYRPAGLAAAAPALVYFHGGGWVLGDLRSGDSVCRCLAVHARVTVISVDYRLAPENQFPSGVDDSIAAFTMALTVFAGLRLRPI